MQGAPDVDINVDLLQVARIFFGAKRTYVSCGEKRDERDNTPRVRE